jgi:hypothetical protein
LRDPRARLLSNGATRDVPMIDDPQNVVRTILQTTEAGQELDAVK